MGDFQSFILWYVLYLDTTSALVGTGSGGFVEAYLNDEVSIPDWTGAALPDIGERIHPNEDPAVYRAVYKFSKSMCLQYARLSQFAVRLRSEASGEGIHGQNSPQRAARHAQIQQFANELYEIWNRDYPSFLPRDPAQAATHLPPLAKILHEHVCHTQPLSIDGSLLVANARVRLTCVLEHFAIQYPNSLPAYKHVPWTTAAQQQRHSKRGFTRVLEHPFHRYRDCGIPKLRSTSRSVPHIPGWIRDARYGYQITRNQPHADDGGHRYQPQRKPLTGPARCCL